MKNIFISHASDADKEIARQVKRWLELAYKDHVNVFVSSTGGIRPGNIPMEDIADAIRGADIMIVLLSPTAIKKAWVVFETGAAFGKSAKILALLCKGAKVEKGPSVFMSAIQMVDMDDINACNDAIGELDAAIGYHHEVSEDELRRQLIAKPYIGTPVGFRRKWVEKL